MTECAGCTSPNAEDASFCRQCGEPIPREDPLLGQEVLGRYRITRLLGEGGMGRVYEAEQRVGTTQRRVAVKTLRPQLSADPQLARRFFREAETIVRLTHPNLIQFFDFGEIQQGILALVMEFIEGRSLADLLAEGPLEATRSERILAQICGALTEAHGLGIVHRDLKPDNILLTRRGGQEDFVKVLDFGIAKLSDSADVSATKLTQQGMMVGTPPYMSPEQFSGENVDARSDIYSLGIISYEMLTGQLPFDARTPWEWASKHLTAEPAPVSRSALTHVADRHERAIRNALAKRPEQRPQEIADFLREFCAGPAKPPAADPHGTGIGPASLRSTPQLSSAVRAQGTPHQAESIAIVGLTAPSTSKRKLLWACGLAGGVLLGAALWFLSIEDPVTAARPPHLPQSEAGGTDRSSLPPAANSAEAATEKTREAELVPNAPRPKHAESRRAAASAVVRDLPAPRQAKEVAPAVVATKSTSLQVQPRGPADQPTSSNSENRKVMPPTNGVPAANALSQAAEADLKARVDRGLSLMPQRVEMALGLFQAASARYGSTQPALEPLRRALAEHGEAHIRELLRVGRCAQAQAFLRALSSAGAAGQARSHFGTSCLAN